jgi:hypothetical protein
MGRLALVVAVLATSATRGAGAQELLLDGFEALDGWTKGSHKESSIALSDAHVTQGQYALRFTVAIDHTNTDTAYAMSWPSVSRVYPVPTDLSSYDFLEFDVFFENSRGVDPDFAINVMAKNSAGKDIYRTNFVNLRHGRWAHQKLCIRDIAIAEDFAQLNFFISESNYDHGDVIDFYFDNLRATRATGYIPPPVMPVRHVLARTADVALWMEGPAEKVQRSEIVDLMGEANPVVNLSLARNETEAVQLIVRPLTGDGAGTVSLTITEPIGPGGARITSDCLPWSPVYYVPAREGPPEGLPDGLPDAAPFLANQQWHYPIWVEVYAPSGTPAGDYASTVTIHTGRGDLVAQLRVHVWDFDIPVVQRTRTNTHVYDSNGWSAEIQGWFGNFDYNYFMTTWKPAVSRMLARYRLCPGGLEYLNVAYDDAASTVVLQYTNTFENKVQPYLDMGHRFNSLPISYQFDRAAFLGAARGTPEYFARISQAFRLAARYLAPKGWLADGYVKCFDEVVVHKYTDPIDFGLLGQALDAIHAGDPRVKVFGAEAPSPILPGVDIWCINISSFDTDVLAEQKALGKGVWWYNGYRSPRPGTRIATRGVDHRVLFWINYKFGIDGYLIWTVNRWVTNPWTTPNRNADTEAGNHYLLYPNPNGTVSPSVRLAMMRDGMEDYEYHCSLAELAGLARANGLGALADECEEVIAQADAFLLSYDNCAHVAPNYLYDSRRLLAEQIEKAQRALTPSGRFPTLRAW